VIIEGAKTYFPLLFLCGQINFYHRGGEVLFMHIMIFFYEVSSHDFKLEHLQNVYTKTSVK
jgi:hypothetical protein